MWVRFLIIFFLALFLIGAVGGCASSGVRQFDAGPVAVSDSNVHGNKRVRSFGPLIETQSRADGMKFVAVRPFYSKTEDPVNERSVSDFMWPLGMMKDLKGEMDWRFFPSFGHDSDINDSETRHRWSVFPLLYGGQGINGEKYFAFFPLGGTLRDFIGIDYVGFILFPLYSHSVKDDNSTHTVLWPIISVTNGSDVHRWRVFPFYGVSRSDDRWTKRFVMWPFWTSVKYDYPNQKGGGFVLWPLFGKVDVGESKARSFLPPFFKWESGPDHKAIFCPWPIVRYKRGKVNQFYVWPLWGTKTIANDKRRFVLWPIGRWRRVERTDYVLRRVSVMPFVTYESKTGKPGAGAAEDNVSAVSDGEVIARYFKLWPLLSYERNEDVLRFRMLALWPIKNAPAIERNWAPLWSLYSRERNGSRVESELLWGLYRRRRDEDERRLSLFPVLQYSVSDAESKAESRREWSLLYGLIGYKREGLQKQFKMLYFLKFGKLEKE
jgi:hypothetical protein